MNIDELRLAKNMKYEALYWALGFEELVKNEFTKKYGNNIVKIHADTGVVDFNDALTIVNGDCLRLDTHKAFVILECLDKLLSMGYSITEIILDLDNEYDIYLNKMYIKCFEWNKEEKDTVEFNKKEILSVTYSSRLISGVIERRTSIKAFGDHVYSHGIFENDTKLDEYDFLEFEVCEVTPNFLIKSGVLIKYCGNDEKVVVPDGVKELASCLFWDNQTIKEVILPDSLINISGDTFYNCTNLEKVNIPKKVKYMGNNPFAGCPKVEVINESKYFNMIDGVLYNKDFTRLIYYPISRVESSYSILDTCRIIGKHAFYLCEKLKKVTIPRSVIKLENNPFSGCTELELDNKSLFYHVEYGVIYDRDYESVIGCLNSIDTDCLVLKDVKRICRNSFWNCKGIRKIILPRTLEDIGYNPFVGCSNIEFVSYSKDYIVYKNVLFNKDKSKLICYPSKFAIGEVFLPDETIILERGAFSGCDKMTNVHLHNVSTISKTCFTNCNLLTEVYCSDLVSYIGEWAFAHCDNLRALNVYKTCFIDKNATINSPVVINKRDRLSNYIIQSDNIYTLKAMNDSYKGKIKSILIDPPYNSHIDYIGYKDEFGASYEDFMLARIGLSYELLTDDGFLVINIDEGEVKNLTSLCQKLFYKVKVHKWEKLHPYFDVNRNVSPNKKKVKYEYIIICYKSSKSKLNKIHQPYLEGDILKEKVSKVPSIFSCFGTNSSAKDEIAEIFGDRSFFATPKPVKLMKELIRATSDKGSIILDFFAGSGTVGQATFELNKEDRGTRKFILISNDESNICQNVTVQRLNKMDINYIFIK